MKTIQIITYLLLFLYIILEFRREKKIIKIKNRINQEMIRKERERLERERVAQYHGLVVDPLAPYRMRIPRARNRQIIGTHNQGDDNE